ncbi:hypothetical protein [Rhodococcus erythropolis]|nr:hypothetical protein [Rhodococcus erythropolis]MCW2295508.1 hypothetical protein [Rhodococcus erythropolis]
MTPPQPDSNRRKRTHARFGMAAETAVVLGCILAAIVIVWWAA